jgi:hypothetical protein
MSYLGFCKYIVGNVPSLIIRTSAFSLKWECVSVQRYTHISYQRLLNWFIWNLVFEIYSINCEIFINSKRLWRRCVMLRTNCLPDFVHRPDKILKYNIKSRLSEDGSSSVFRWWEGTHLLRWVRLARSKRTHLSRCLSSHHLKTEEEPASETSWFYIFIYIIYIYICVYLYIYILFN